MIASIRGTITRKAADYCIVDVAGVGYQVFVPLSTFCNVPEPGGEVMLHVHTHLREDSLSLFGFLTEPEKEMFLLLMSVSGIGPKLALAVLSSLPVPELCCALQASDDARLCAVPGIGKKTAARMVLELKDKIGAVSPGKGDLPAGASPGGLEDILSALVNLGYKRAQAEEAAKKAMQRRPGMSMEDMIREALTLLMNR